MSRKTKNVGSPKYKIFIAEEYDKQLKKLPPKDRALIEKKMEEYVIPQLKIEPHLGLNIKKLKNYEPPTWRYRIGKYRVFYEIDDEAKEVNILTIYPRKDAY
jgi:mRNA interferase RelE/StbE